MDTTDINNVVDLGTRFGKRIPILGQASTVVPGDKDGEDEVFPIYEFAYKLDGAVVTHVAAGFLFFTPNVTGCHVGSDDEGNLIFNFVVTNDNLVSIMQVEEIIND